MTEPTEEQVDAVAKAIFRQAAKFYQWRTPWEKLLDNTRTQYGDEARAAIAAMPAPGVSEPTHWAVHRNSVLVGMWDEKRLALNVLRDTPDGTITALRALSQCPKEDG